MTRRAAGRAHTAPRCGYSGPVRPSAAPGPSTKVRRMHACTIVARNYLAFARVLAESFLRIHPDSSFTTLVVDAEFGFDPTGEPFNVVTPAELDLSTEEFHRMAVMYDVTELSTALKPWT